MFDLPRPARLGLSSLAVVAVALAVGLVPSPRTVSADDLCAEAGSPAGPFDIVAYEAADWRTTYGKTLELASQNLLLPDIARFSVPRLETGPRSAGSSTLVDPYIPPTLLKAIAWIESHWMMADWSVDYGEVGPPLLSHSCAYGIMQIQSGMQNTTGRPNLNQVMIGGHYGFNIAEGANILATKWNAAPNYRPIVGTRQPSIVEDWYYALWSYHGFTFRNHPLNPSYSPSRGVYRCDGTQSYSSFPFQELVLGCVANPPVVGGTPLWRSQPVTLPSLSYPAFSLTNWNACSNSRQCAGMDIPTPTPSHTDPTTVSGNRTQAMGSPSLAVSASNFDLVVKAGRTSKSNAVTVSNTGTGPLVWRLSPSVNWLELPKIQGVSLGTDLGSVPASFNFSVDASAFTTGNYAGVINLQSHYTQGLPKAITVNLSVPPVSWALSSSQMVAADVNGDGKDDIVGIYDNGNGILRVWNFVSNGADFASVRQSYAGCTGCWELSQSQMVVADVNGDGKDDIVGIYDYGDGVIGMWNFISNGTTFATVRRSYSGCTDCWDLNQSQMLAADVNGDGKDDIVGIYDYGDGVIGMWNFISDGTGFTAVRRSYSGCTDCWELSQSQMVVADVNGDGKDDIVGIYDYGGRVMGMWNFISNGTAFATGRRSYSGCADCWELSQSQMVGADLDGDGKGDILGIYDYGNGRMGMWNFLSNGAGFPTAKRSYRGCDGCWDLSRAQMTVGDVNTDGQSDVVGAYDYGSGVMGMWHFVNRSGGFSTHRSY